MTPRPYQIAGRDFLASHRHALLADEMRVGKTPQAILAAHKLGAKSIMVTCPAIAVEHWKREIQKWWPGDTLPLHRVVSYDKAREMWATGLKGSVDVFIPDECHYAKNPDALRTKAVYSKTGFAAHAGATWALSGTPATKHAGELWPMFRAFGVVGCDYMTFCRAYCNVGWDGKVRSTKVSKIPELKAMLAKIMLRRTRKEVAPDMPDIGFEFLEVDIQADLSDTYRKCFNEGAINSIDKSDFDADDRIAVAMAKVPHLAAEIVFALDNGLLKQTVVFGWHTEPLMALRDTLARQHGIQALSLTGQDSSTRRTAIQDGFRNGTVQVICANILAAGTAIDLSVASHGYFLELDWLGVNNLQAANRLVSLDKSEPVTFDILTCPGSVDDAVQRVLVRRMSELKALGVA